jgi:hypothetical protein
MPQLSLPTRARLAGSLYLAIIVLGIFEELGVRDRVTVSGDAAATAQNILAHEALYRMGFAAGLLVLLCALPVLVLLYEILRVADRTQALLAACINLVAIAIQGAALLGHFAPLVLLGGGRSLDAIEPAQLHSLAYFSLRMQSVGYDTALAFFGLFCVVTGILIYRSSFLPKAIGVLMAIAGACYLFNSFAGFLAPGFRASLLPWILLPCLVGEGSLTFWLLVKGVDLRRWEESASRDSLHAARDRS